MQLAGATVLPMVLTSALELDLLEIISKNAGLAGGQLSPSEIASHLSTKNPDAPVMVDWILRLLVAYSILNCSARKLLDGGMERLYRQRESDSGGINTSGGASLPDSSLLTKVVHMDCLVLAHNPGGKEQTEEEFVALAKGSGFQGFQVVCKAFGTRIIEFLKKI